MLVDVSYPKWRILFCNGRFDLTTGLSGSELTGQHVWDHFTVCGKNEVHNTPICAAGTAHLHIEQNASNAFAAAAHTLKAEPPKALSSCPFVSENTLSPAPGVSVDSKIGTNR